MASGTTSPAPGSMTVPPWFGWEVILVVLVVLVVVAVAFIVVGTARAGRSERSEWQAWLAARSSAGYDPTADRHDGAGEPVRPPRP